MASKETLAKLVCLGTVREFHLDSRVSLSCFVGSNHLVNDGSATVISTLLFTIKARNSA